MYVYRIRFYICVSALIFISVARISGQRLPKAEALTVEDGLNFRDVTAIVQDKQGLMWFGTKQGLNRYDGYQVKVFTKGNHPDQSFPGEEIMLDGMLLSDDSLMIGVDKRLYKFNRRTFTSHLLSVESGIEGDLLQLRKSVNGNIWTVSENKENQFLSRSEDGKEFHKVANVARGRREFTSLAIDTFGNAWWSTIQNGLQQFSPDGKQMLQMKPDSFIWFGTKMYFIPVNIDRQNRIFLFPKSKYQIWLYRPDEKKMEVIRDSLSGPAFNSIEDSQANVWFTTKSQLLRWNSDGTWTNYSDEIQNTLQFTNIQCLYEDQSNLLWVATDNGLLKIPIQRQLFRISASIPGESWGNAMRSIFEDNSYRIFAYCETGSVGLHQVFPASKQNSAITIRAPLTEGIEFMGGSKHFISSLEDNSVWTLTDKLIKIDLNLMAVTEAIDFTYIAEGFFHNPLVRLSDGQFLMGIKLDRLTLYNPATHVLKKFQKESTPHDQSVKTEFFLENKDASIWIATDNDGLYRYDTTGSVLQHLTTDTKPSLSSNHLIVLHNDGDTLLWIGTFGGGLDAFNVNKQSIQVFTQKEGLANDNVTGILEDAKGNIWVSTYNGLSCYQKKEGSFQNYYEEDGLSNNEFNYTSFLKDHIGRLWFGGMNGVNYFDPAEILESVTNPSLCFTGFSKYNRIRDSLETHILGEDTLAPIVISPYDSYFQFTWTLPNYFKPDKNRYYVWLEGLEKGWSYLGNVPIVRYHKLPSGNYKLHIKGADSKGNWSEKELSVQIHVRPFFYTTWWFLFLCVVGIAGLVYAFTRYRLQRLLEMERMRMRIAGDLHDEVGSMLSGLAMQAEILELDQQKTDPARLRRLSDISRLTLSKMRDVVWSIDSRRDQVKNLLDRMREHAEEMLTPKEMIFQFVLGDLPLEKKLRVDARQHLFLFFKEAITNIVKHSNATIVTIHFGQFGDHFELSVEDNGTTVSSTGSTGFGLQNMEMRTKKLGASFELKRDHGFQVKLKLKSL